MGIVDAFKNAVEEKINKEEAPQSPIVSQTPEAPIETEVVTTPEVPVQPVTEAPKVDRSAFNCLTCGGEGLIEDTFEDGGYVRCPICNGTGKI